MYVHWLHRGAYLGRQASRAPRTLHHANVPALAQPGKACESRLRDLRWEAHGN